MTRFPLRLKPILATIVLLTIVGSVCAQEVTPRPLEYRRVFVPDAQVGLWPTQNERYIPVTEENFRQLLDAANQDAKAIFFASPTVTILSADYETRLEDEPQPEKISASETGSAQVFEEGFLSGHARLHVVTKTTNGIEKDAKPSFLLLGPANLSLKNILWAEGKEPVQTGIDQLGRLIAQVDRSGVLEFDFTARNRATKPGELRFDLTLPRSTRATFNVSLDTRWDVSVPTGLLLDQKTTEATQAEEVTQADVPTQPEQASKADTSPESPAPTTSSPIYWTVAPALDGRLSLLLTRKKDPHDSPQIPDISSSLGYHFSPQGLELRGVLQLTTSDTMLPERLYLGLEKPLTLISARLGSVPVRWSLESEKEGRTIVSFELPKSRPRSTTLRIKAACPIVVNGEWMLPRVMPENVFWHAGNITLSVASPLTIGKLIPLGCMQTKTGKLPEHTGRSVELTSFQSDATATISLGWEKYLPTLSSGTVAELSGVGTSVTQTFLFTPSEEDRFELNATVHPDWIIDSVEANSNAVIADWQVEPQEDRPGAKLVVRLASALSKRHGPLRLTLSARHLESPLGKKLGIEDLTPVRFEEVYLDHCLVAVMTVEPYSIIYQGEEFVDSITTDSLTAEQGSLFPQIPSGRLFLDNARAARLEILLEEQKPLYAATVETIITLTEKKLIERYRFACTPEASHIDRLLIHLSSEEDSTTGIEREKGTLHFLPKPMNASFPSEEEDVVTEASFLTLSPKAFSAVKLTPADQASVGMSSGGETWEITLKTPQSEPFEFYAIRSLDYAATLPLTISPGLAAMPDAVEHQASLQVETADDTVLWIKNQRLEPITITPPDPLKIQKLRAAFHYETTDALATPSDPAIRLTIGKSNRTSLLAWKCVVQTAYGSDGLVKATARYDLENQGESYLWFLMPEKASALTVIDVALDGKYVGWQPEYASKTGTVSASKPASRLTAMRVELPHSKRFPSVTINYSYRTDPLGVVQPRSLLAPRPECEVISVNWRILTPPGYESPDYVALNAMPSDIQTQHADIQKQSSEKTLAEKTTPKSSTPADLFPKVSPRMPFCWRTCLFGPIGRPAARLPFNPFSLDAWAKMLDSVHHEAMGAEAASTPSTLEQLDSTPVKVQAENYPDWNIYQLHHSSFDQTQSIRIVHHDSLEVFRWTSFLITIALMIWTPTARRIRRFSMVIVAALAAVFLPPLFSAMASGFLLGVLVALLAVWLLDSGNGNRPYSFARTIITPDRSGGVLSTTARHSRSAPIGSTATTPAVRPRPLAPQTNPTPDTGEGPDPDKTEKRFSSGLSNGTNIELGKVIEDDTVAPTLKPESKPESKPQPKPSDSVPRGGSTIIRRTTMFWLLLTGFAFGGSFVGSTLADTVSNTKSVPTQVDLAVGSKTSPVPWPVLVPTEEKEAAASLLAPMLYLPEPFFRSLEGLARHQVHDRDLWLLKDASLRVILARTDSKKEVQPTFVFLSVEVTAFSDNVEVQLPLSEKEVRLEESQATLDGRPFVPQWTDEGTSLRIPIAGRGAHHIELALIPSINSHVTRWNIQKQRDESGFQIRLPRFPQTRLELTHPADMPQPVPDDLLDATKESSTTTRATLAPEGRLAVWWSSDMLAESAETRPELDELLLLDVMPNSVTLQGSWSLASDELTVSSEQNRLAPGGNRLPSRFRDITLSIDPQLRLVEMTDGFTLQPILGSSEKRQRLKWDLTSDPPKHVYAKFVMDKTGGIGQFHAPTLRVDQGHSVRHWFAVRVAENLNYEVHLPDAASKESTPQENVSQVTPEAFMAVWQKKLALESKENVATLTSDPKSGKAPSFVITSGDESVWSFHTQPKSIVPTVVHQTVRVSFGETAASVRFDAEWTSGSCDMPEPSLRVPQNFKLHSVYLIDDGIRQSVSWSYSDEGFIHLTTGLLPPKRRTIRMEGTLERIDPSEPVALPIISVVGAEEVPVYLGIYRKPDALVALDWKKLPVQSELPSHISNGWFEGRPVFWLKQKPLDAAAADVRITPNRPTVRARQVVTISSVSNSAGGAARAAEVTASEDAASEGAAIATNPTAASASTAPVAVATAATTKTIGNVEPYEMIAAFELVPSQGVIDEIAVFVPNTVVGPFRTEPILPLVRSQESDKGRTLVFRPKEPIEQWHQFRLSSPMAPGETRIPDIKLCGVDDLKRYVVLPAKLGQNEDQQWQTRLLNRETDQAILGNLMPIEQNAQMYSVVGRQWLALASSSKVTNLPPTVSLADVQVRWQEDGSYLASAVFDLKPSGNESCRLIVPQGLTLLDTRIAGVPVSLIEVTNDVAKQPASNDSSRVEIDRGPHTAYEIHFTSKTLPQRIEVLYQKSMKKESRLKPTPVPLSGILHKTFKTPSLDVEVQQTRWTVQGPEAYLMRGEFEIAETDQDRFSTSNGMSPDGVAIDSLTPFLIPQVSLGVPVRWTFDGFQGEWQTVWRSQIPDPLVALIPTALSLLAVGGLALIRPIRTTCASLSYRYRSLFGISIGLFWWLFLLPSFFGWVIMILFLVAAYRSRVSGPENDSSIVQIG